MIRLFTLLAIVIALVCGGCSRPEAEQSGRISVAVSIFPIYDIARNICAESASVFYVIPAGADPHTFEPLPSTARRLQSASIYIGVSREFDGWAERFLPTKTTRLYLIEQVNVSGGDNNPHIWLSVRKAKIIAAVIARGLVSVDPANRARYDSNLAAYGQKLENLDNSIAAIFRNMNNTSFIQWHEAWNYFAADYGLTIAGTVQREGSDKVSVRSMKDIIERAKRSGARAVAVSLNDEDRSARVLAGEIGGSIVHLDGIGDPGSVGRSNYYDLMLYNAKTLAESLR